MLNEDDCLLLDKISDEVSECMNNSHSLAYLKVLDEYRSALTYSSSTIESAVKEYTSVLGATCQQAAGNPMAKLKQVQYQDLINFDTVIVDEAARANPLDLMVPMAMGKRRIVLVGDHRQLPHLLEPEVEDELAEKYELNEVHKDMLNTSLFERMMHDLQSMEKEKKTTQKSRYARYSVSDAPHSGPVYQQAVLRKAWTGKSKTRATSRTL